MTFKEAVKLALDKEGYEPCTRSDHGFGTQTTIHGVTGPVVFMICPIVQFYPRPTYQFHSKKAFVRSTEVMARNRGWL